MADVSLILLRDSGINNVSHLILFFSVSEFLVVLPTSIVITHFFTRLTEEVVTIWIALSDVPADLGPLYLIKGSDQFEDHLSTIRGFDLMKQTDR